MNKVVKKIAAVALSGLLVASVFAGCSGGSAKDTYTVGICQAMQHPALDKATEGFKKALTDKLGDKVTFKEQNAAGDSTLCSTIVNQYVSQNVDLIMANATDALVAARTATNTIPIVGTSITSYGVALGLKDETATKTGINVTGTADLAPLDKQAAMVKEWVPNAKKVGILYCSAEKNSKYQATVVGAKLKEMGAQNVLVSMAGDGALLLDEHGKTHVCGVCKGTVKNSVGAGDSMVAGFLAGSIDGDYAYALKLGTATGGATAFSDGLAKREEIDRLLQQL